jgi:hypothetical protein
VRYTVETVLKFRFTQDTSADDEQTRAEHLFSKLAIIGLA